MPPVANSYLWIRINPANPQYTASTASAIFSEICHWSLLQDEGHEGKGSVQGLRVLVLTINMVPPFCQDMQPQQRTPELLPLAPPSMALALKITGAGTFSQFLTLSSSLSRVTLASLVFTCVCQVRRGFWQSCADQQGPVC